MVRFVLIARSVLAFGLLLPMQVFAQEGREIARNTFPSVVLIVADHSRSQRGSLGSGFFVEENLIITNYHVIKGFPRIRIKLVGGSNTYAVQVLGTNSTTDLALLKVLGTRASPLRLAELNDVEVGDRIYAIGNPEGLEATLSNGIISGIRQVGGKRYIQISAPISHGSSGGPILNTAGEVIAVAVGTLKSGQNLNFAIPVSEVAALRDQFAGTPRTPANAAAKSSTPISRRLQLPSKARDSLNAALQLVERQPNSGDARVKLANLYLEFYFYEGSSVEAAIKEYKRAIQLNPRLAEAYFGLAESYIKAIPPSRSYQRQNELREAAINLYKQAIRINPDHVDAHLGLGNALCDVDRRDEGIAMIRLAISLDPKNPKAYRDLGMALRFSQRSDQAIEAFKKASALDRLPGYYLSLIADVYKETERCEKAIHQYQEALRVQNFLGQGEYYGLIECYIKSARLEEGIAYFKTVITKIGDGPTIDGDQTRAVSHYALGMLYAHVGDKHAALQQYKLLNSFQSGRFQILLAEELFDLIYK